MQDLLTGNRRVTGLLDPQAPTASTWHTLPSTSASMSGTTSRSRYSISSLVSAGRSLTSRTRSRHRPDTGREEGFHRSGDAAGPPHSRSKVINPWLEEDQVEEVVKQLTASFPSTGLLENNRHLFQLLLENTSVNENRQTRRTKPYRPLRRLSRSRDNNSFIAVCQFKVRILGTEHHIVPDIVLFLNGLPVVVIECKSPKVKDAIPEAIDQLMRYSEQRGSKGEGSPRLFYHNQFIVATCGLQAKFGTITTHSEKYFYRWADPYPRTVDELDHGLRSPNDQQRLVAGMLDRDNLLDLIRTFTLFSTNDKGETIKIVGRYQQFRAVKLAVKRLMDGKRRERSGIIWHTQGSGKSLTMMFMVRRVRSIRSAAALEGRVRHGPHATGAAALGHRRADRRDGEGRREHRGQRRRKEFLAQRGPGTGLRDDPEVRGAEAGTDARGVGRAEASGDLGLFNDDGQGDPPDGRRGPPLAHERPSTAA